MVSGAMSPLPVAAAEPEVLAAPGEWPQAAERTSITKTASAVRSEEYKRELIIVTSLFHTPRKLDANTESRHASNNKRRTSTICSVTRNSSWVHDKNVTP